MAFSLVSRGLPQVPPHLAADLGKEPPAIASARGGSEDPVQSVPATCPRRSRGLVTACAVRFPLAASFQPQEMVRGEEPLCVLFIPCPAAAT